MPSFFASRIAEILLVRVDDEDHVRRAAHLADAAERLLELGLLALEPEPLLLGQAAGAAGELLVDRLQPGDRLRDGLPVGQRAAEPAVVHVVLRRALGRFRDRLLRLPLGADEEDAATLRHGLLHRVQRLVEQRHGLGQVDDVDAVAVAVDVRPHARVPAVGLVAEVDAGFEELAQGEFRQSHGSRFPFPVSPRRGEERCRPTGGLTGMSPPRAAPPPVDLERRANSRFPAPLQGDARPPPSPPRLAAPHWRRRLMKQPLHQRLGADLHFLLLRRRNPRDAAARRGRIAATSATLTRRSRRRPVVRRRAVIVQTGRAPVTRQITSPTSSATRSAPSGPSATPTGRP